MAVCKAAGDTMSVGKQQPSLPDGRYCTTWTSRGQVICAPAIVPQVGENSSRGFPLTSSCLADKALASWVLSAGRPPYHCLFTGGARNLNPVVQAPIHPVDTQTEECGNHAICASWP